MSDRSSQFPVNVRVPTRAFCSSRRGFSLIEVMIASVLLLIVALGVLPLFTRSIVNNVAGGEYSEVSNLARSRAEQFRRLPFTSAEMTIDPGNDERLFEDYYSHETSEWIDGAPPDDDSDTVLWERTTIVRQYGVAALRDGEGDGG